MSEQYRCPDCGKNFGSEETFQEHMEIDHPGGLNIDTTRLPDLDPQQLIQKMRAYLNRSFALGLIIGLLIASAGFSGYLYWQSLDHRTPVPVTVVTCDSCTYDKFRTATDRIFNAKYREVNYQSEEGQRLIQKYNIKYVPAFIFDKKVAETENFYRVKSILVEFDDAYVLPDRSPRAAQRLSNGTELQQR